MGQVDVLKNAGGIEGLCVITPVVHGDSRGCFSETYNYRDLAEAGINTVFVQDNQARSTKGVLRGLHFQKEKTQAKLLRAIKGEVFDVAVDLRQDSKTCGKWYGELLSAENGKQLYIPKGFAHGYLVLSAIAEICYKCDDYYYPQGEGGVCWNDPEIGIKWPKVEGEYKGNGKAEGYKVDGSPIVLNARDENWPGLKEILSLKLF